MQLAKVYDKISQTYNQGQSVLVLEKSKQAALEFILQQTEELAAILSFGVGDGSDFLAFHQHYPQAELHGLDLSEKMLEKTRAMLPVNTYCGDAASAATLIEKRNFDLLMAYFLIAYVPLDKILSQAKLLLRSQGLISLVSSTQESFASGQQIAKQFAKSSNPIDRFFLKHIEKTRKSVKVPNNVDHMVAMIEKNGFTVVKSTEIEIPLSFYTDKEVYAFFVDGSWFASVLSHPFIPERFIRKLCMIWIRRHVRLPLHDCQKIAIVLAQKS